MTSERMAARIAGASFLISYLGLILGALLLSTILDAPDYLAIVYPNATLVGIGVLIESVNGIAVIVIAVMLYPILKQYDENLALGFLVFRTVEGLFSIIGSLKAASLIEISHAYIQAGSPADSYFDALGALVLAERHWNMEMLTVFLILGAMIFYVLLLRSELVPRFISIWGIVAVLLITVFNALIYLGIDFGVVMFLLALPMVANEFFIAIWLIVKGVNTSANASQST
ncbi:MAG: DUF4386 family protein [Candidatus Thorarchaeota archaeon]|nr:DUF4386 family protein [Candidatus Thorarchaeota archaeon]